jgi:phage gp36-like protein
MYCSYTDIIRFKSAAEIMDLVNDEKLPYSEIDLDDPVSKCRQRIDEAIQAADAEIDSYLRQRYCLPLTETPVLIKYNSISLALEYLYSRRIPCSIPEAVISDAKSKRQMLKNIAEGFIGIGTEMINSKPAAGTYRSNKENTSKVFTKDILDKY